MRESRVDLNRASGAVPHPDLDQWIAYRGHELSGSEEDRLRRHLAACPTCVALVLDLEAFEAGASCELGGERQVRVSDFEMTAAWRAMKAAIDRGSIGAAGAPAAGAPENRLAAVVPFRDRRVSLPLALAASFLLGALGLALWGFEHRTVSHLRGAVAQLSEPQVNMPIRDLFPDTATRGGAAAKPAEVPEAGFFTLVLNLAEPRAFTDYEVEVLTEGGDLVWSGRGFRMSPYGNFTLGLARRVLNPDEEHQVRLYGLEGEEKELLQEYSVYVD